MDITAWHLSTCSTCSRIFKELEINDANAELIDIKSYPVTADQLDRMKDATGSYTSLINGRSRQFRTMDKKARDLNESEARALLLSHYAFLKRPVVRIGRDYYVGNSKKTIAEMKKRLNHG